VLAPLGVFRLGPEPCNSNSNSKLHNSPSTMCCCGYITAELRGSNNNLQNNLNLSPQTPALASALSCRTCMMQHCHICHMLLHAAAHQRSLPSADQSTAQPPTPTRTVVAVLINNGPQTPTLIQQISAEHTGRTPQHMQLKELAAAVTTGRALLPLSPLVDGSPC